jgi:hypothetical protein
MLSLLSACRSQKYCKTVRKFPCLLKLRKYLIGKNYFEKVVLTETEEIFAMVETLLQPTMVEELFF